MVCADEKSTVSVVEVDTWLAEGERGVDDRTGEASVDGNISVEKSSLDSGETIDV